MLLSYPPTTARPFFCVCITAAAAAAARVGDQPYKPGMPDIVLSKNQLADLNGGDLVRRLTAFLVLFFVYSPQCVVPNY